MPGAIGDHIPGDAATFAGYVTQEDTYVENGSLVLRGQKRPFTGQSPPGNYDYTTGMVMSIHRVHFNIGYVEIRAQLPSGDKVLKFIHLHCFSQIRMKTTYVKPVSLY